MNACMGSCFAGDVAKSQALFSFNDSYDASAETEALFEDFDIYLDAIHNKRYLFMST